MAIKQVLAAAIAVMNCGCAALTTDCTQDWYESGHRHGRFASQPWDVQYAAACGNRFDRARYLSGWEAGASERPLPVGL